MLAFLHHNGDAIAGQTFLCNLVILASETDRWILLNRFSEASLLPVYSMYALIEETLAKDEYTDEFIAG